MIAPFNLLNPPLAARTELDFSASDPLFIGVVNQLLTSLPRMPLRPTVVALLPHTHRTRHVQLLLTPSHHAITVELGAPADSWVFAKLSSDLEFGVLGIELRDELLDLVLRHQVSAAVSRTLQL
jgi:hypothetical protein